MKSKLVMALSALAFTLGPVYAADMKCACSAKCMENCQKGDSTGCKCKMCECAKSKQCSKEHCSGKAEDGSHSH